MRETIELVDAAASRQSRKDTADPDEPLADLLRAIDCALLATRYVAIDTGAQGAYSILVDKLIQLEALRKDVKRIANLRSNRKGDLIRDHARRWGESATQIRERVDALPDDEDLGILFDYVRDACIWCEEIYLNTLGDEGSEALIISLQASIRETIRSGMQIVHRCTEQ